MHWMDGMGEHVWSHLIKSETTPVTESGSECPTMHDAGTPVEGLNTSDRADGLRVKMRRAESAEANAWVFEQDAFLCRGLVRLRLQGVPITNTNQYCTCFASFRPALFPFFPRPLFIIVVSLDCFP